MASKKTEDESNKWQKIAEASEKEAPESEEETFSLEQEPEQSLEFPSHEKLEAELTAKEQEVEKYKDQAIRAKAEVENIRRRAERDVQNAHKFGIERLLNDLLPVVDSLERGLENGAQDDPMREGLEMTLALLEKSLEKHGIEAVDPKKGEAFDPDQHEAMSMQADPKAKPNTVLNVVQRGYKLNGRVLRAARVIVAAG